MTVRAELDERGQALYGTRSLRLDTEPRTHVLFDETTKLINPPIGLWRVVDVPSTFDLDAAQLSSVRWQLAVVGDNRVEVTRFTPSDDGESQLARTELYEGSDIDYINVLNSRVNLPGIRPDEFVSARVKWERDIPIISRLKRGLENFRNASRIESVFDLEI